jgi:hypothetical protein
VKKLAKLVLFFSLSFVVLFLVSTGLRFLAIRVNWIRVLPQRPETMLSELIRASHWALSLALYGSILLSLSYAARERVFAPLTVAGIAALSLGFSFALSVALERMPLIPPAQFLAGPLGGEGLILTQNNDAIVLLKKPEETRGPRVLALAGRPVLYQAGPPGGNAPPGLPPIPFQDETPWFLRSISIDINLSAARFTEYFERSLLSFAAYAGALIFFLASLGFVVKVSAWPLANLFLGCLAFRGVLALETFFNSPEMQDVFGTLAGNRFPLSFMVPLIFCAFGALVYLYSILVYLARRRRDEED